MALKRYLLFAGINFYCEGGWGDFIKSFDDFEEAKEVGNSLIATRKNFNLIEWAHVVDTENEEVYSTGWMLSAAYENEDKEEWEKQ